MSQLDNFHDEVRGAIFLGITVASLITCIAWTIWILSMFLQEPIKASITIPIFVGIALIETRFEMRRMRKYSMRERKRVVAIAGLLLIIVAVLTYLSI